MGSDKWKDLFEANDAVCWLGESLFPQLFDPEGPMSMNQERNQHLAKMEKLCLKIEQMKLNPPHTEKQTIELHRETNHRY